MISNELPILCLDQRMQMHSKHSAWWAQTWVLQIVPMDKEHTRWKIKFHREQEALGASELYYDSILTKSELLLVVPKTLADILPRLFACSGSGTSTTQVFPSRKRKALCICMCVCDIINL